MIINNTLISRSWDWNVRKPHPLPSLALLRFCTRKALWVFIDVLATIDNMNLNSYILRGWMENDALVKLFFDAFANTGRFKILELLLDGPMSVNGIAEALMMEQTLTSHNLKCLENCRFVDKKTDGRLRIYGIRDDARGIVRDVIRHLKRYEKYIMSCNAR
jgi:DNA-binding transcriptional ArsR family regulator